MFRCVLLPLLLRLSVLLSLCTYLGFSRALSCNTFAAFSWPSFLSSLAGAGKTLIFQFVAEFLVIFLLPQFGARSVVVVVSLCFSRCFLLPYSFFFALQLFALRFSLLRFVVVSFVQCNKFHLTANEGTRHPPTATDGFLAFSLSLSLSRYSFCVFSLLLLLVVVACVLSFAIYFYFPCAPYYLLFLLCAVHTDTHTDTHAAHSPIRVFTVTFTCVLACVCSAICCCLFARVCLCFLFHFTLSAFMLVFLLLLLFTLRLWLAQINWNISKMSAKIYPICLKFRLSCNTAKEREEQWEDLLSICWEYELFL